MSTYPEFKWKEISPEAYACIFAALGGRQGMKVFGAITDLSGTYGEPLIMTEWGPIMADFPILKSERNPKKPELMDKLFIAYWYEVHA